MGKGPGLKIRGQLATLPSYPSWGRHQGFGANGVMMNRCHQLCRLEPLAYLPWDLSLQYLTLILTESRASLGTQAAKNLPAMQETQVNLCIGKIPWRREWQPTSVFSPEELHGQRSQADYNPWDCKDSYRTEQLTHTHTHTRGKQEHIMFVEWLSESNCCVIFYLFHTESKVQSILLKYTIHNIHNGILLSH